MIRDGGNRLSPWEGETMLKSILSLVPAAAIAVFALGHAAPASAVPVNVTYDIGFIGTSLAAGGQGVQFGGSDAVGLCNGSPCGGQITIQWFNGTVGGHVSAGNGHVVGGFVSATSNYVLDIGIGILTFSGTTTATFGGSGFARATAGGGFVLNTVGHIGSGFVQCNGALCSLAGLPSGVPVPLTSGPRTLHVSVGAITAGFPSLGPQSFAGTGMASGAGNVLTLLVTGQEVSRTVVPEPGTGLLVGLGLAGLGMTGGAFGARRRR